MAGLAPPARREASVLESSRSAGGAMTGTAPLQHAGWPEMAIRLHIRIVFLRPRAGLF
jgi:hypothetical protein